MRSMCSQREFQVPEFTEFKNLRGVDHRRLSEFRFELTPLDLARANDAAAFLAGQVIFMVVPHRFSVVSA